MNNKLKIVVNYKTNKRQKKLSFICKKIRKRMADTEFGMHKEEETSGGGGNWVLWGFLWFVIIFIIVFVILVALNPKWVQKRGRRGRRGGSSSGGSSDSDCSDSSSGKGKGRGGKCGVVDYGMAAVWAFFITLIIVIILWVVAAVSGRGSSTTHKKTAYVHTTAC